MLEALVIPTAGKPQVNALICRHRLEAGLVNFASKDSATLSLRTKSTHSKTSSCLMFRAASGGSLSPEFKGSVAQLLPHQLYDFPGSQSKLSSNTVERCAIFPRHLDDSVNFARRKFFVNHVTRNCCGSQIQKTRSQRRDVLLCGQRMGLPPEFAPRVNRYTWQ
jgi:hypothetical protein